MSSNNADLMVGNRPLSSLRVVDLKQELEKRGLSKSGSKKDLVDRLRLHLQIEKHRDSGATADEEELPNYSVHGDLADQNPFIRDYLASQAELFHSQKVVKKLVEEEAKRESETSADESVDTPVKQPPPPVLEKQQSPVVPVAETRRQTRRRLDSQKEDMTAEKVVTTRSSRSRSPAAATEPNDAPVQTQQPRQVAPPPEKPPEPLRESKPSPQKKTAEVQPLVTPVKKTEEPLPSPRKKIAAEPQATVQENREPSPEKKLVVDSAPTPEKKDVDGVTAFIPEKTPVEPARTPEKIEEKPVPIPVKAPGRPTPSPEKIQQETVPIPEQNTSNEPAARTPRKTQEESVLLPEKKTSIEPATPPPNKTQEEPLLIPEEKTLIEPTPTPEKIQEKFVPTPEKKILAEPKPTSEEIPKEPVPVPENKTVDENPPQANKMIVSEPVLSPQKAQSEERQIEKESPKAKVADDLKKPESNKEVEAMAVDKENNEISVTNSEKLPKSGSSSPSPVVPVETKNSFEVAEAKDEAKDEPMEIDAPTDKIGRSRSSSPVTKPSSPERKKDEVHDKDAARSKDQEDSGSSSDEDDRSSRSKGRSSRSRSRSRSESKSRSRSRSRSRSVDSRDSRGEDCTAEKKSDAEENDEESRDGDSARAEVETPKKTRKSRSRSRSPSRSPVREKSPIKKTQEVEEEQDREDHPETKSEVVNSIEKSEKTNEISRYKSSQQKETYSKYDLAGEEALDYGEEEDDEDRTDNDPQEFTWVRRTMRLKNKPPPIPAPSCKWKLEEDSKHLIVKSNLLNGYYEDIKLVPLEQLKLEEKSSEGPEKPPEKVERKPSSISREISTEEPLPTRTVTVENDHPSIKRTISITVSNTNSIKLEHMEENDKTLTPPRNPPSNVLLITNLVRPFTLPQLKEMLQRTGNLQDIWVDKIKSRCIAKYKSQEEAFETRAALHGVCWPTSNPKSLHVDYSTQDNLDDHKARDSNEQNSVTEKPVTAQPVPVREWDVGKKAEPKSPTRTRKRSRTRSPSPSRDRNKRSRRSSSPGRRRHSSRSPGHERRSRGGEGIKEPEPMGKALDELFRKTVATPSIYWLPLTPEQIAEKEELRRKRMLERERRLAELSKMRPR